MGCCGGKYAGALKRPPTAHLAGYSGIIAVRYTGQVELGRLPAAIFSGVRYEYGIRRPVFYVDARELSRVLAWTENGRKVFWVDGVEADDGGLTDVGLEIDNDPVEVGQTGQDAG